MESVDKRRFCLRSKINEVDFFYNECSNKYNIFIKKFKQMSGDGTSVLFKLTFYGRIKSKRI